MAAVITHDTAAACRRLACLSGAASLNCLANGVSWNVFLTPRRCLYCRASLPYWAGEIKLLVLAGKLHRAGHQE